MFLTLILPLAGIMANFHSLIARTGPTKRTPHSRGEISTYQQRTAACGSFYVPAVTKSSEISERLRNFGDNEPITGIMI
jgi:hypothetical protein